MRVLFQATLLKCSFESAEELRCLPALFFHAGASRNQSQALKGLRQLWLVFWLPLY